MNGQKAVGFSHGQFRRVVQATVRAAAERLWACGQRKRVAHMPTATTTNAKPYRYRISQQAIAGRTHAPRARQTTHRFRRGGNNLIYNVSEVAIPFDNVDPESITGPVTWDVKLIERFMLVFGPVSSIFDFLTFYALLALLGAGEAVFQTGWFIESMVTQALVVFCIRTRRVFFLSRPGRFLIGTTAAAVAVAIALPLLPWGRWFGFVPPPPLFFAWLVGITAAYLALVEAAKAVFYRLMPVGWLSR